MSTKAQSSTAPQSLIHLIWYIVKSVIKNLPKTFIRGIIVGLVIFVIHTFLLVGPNGGFAPGTNRVLDMMLSLRGKLFSGTLFSIVATSLIMSILTRVKQEGLKKVIGELVTGIVTVIKCFKQKIGSHAITEVLLGTAGVFVFSLLLYNPLIGLILSLMMIMSIGRSDEGLLMLIIRLGWSDFQKIFHKKNPKAFNKEKVIHSLAGVILGFLILFFIFLLEVNNGFRVTSTLLIVLLVLVILLIIINKRKKTSSSTTLLFLLTMGGTFFLMSNRIIADDGGWSEAGGSLGSWIGSQGAAQAFGMGLGPAVVGGVTGIVASTITGLVPTLTNIPVPPIVTPIPPVDPDVPPVDPPVETTDPPEKTQTTDDKEKIEKERIEKEKLEKEKKEKERLEKERLEKERKEKERERLEKERKEKERQKKIAELKERQKQLEKEAEAANRTASWWDWGTKAVETVQVVADTGVDLLANVTGPVGGRIKDVYTVAKGSAEGLGTAIAEGGNYAKNITEGTVKGVSDLVKDKLKGTKFDEVYKIGEGAVKGAYQTYQKGGSYLENITKGALKGGADVIMDKVTGKLIEDGVDPGVDWGKARVGFVKDGLKGKNMHSSVSNIIKDRVKTAVDKTGRDAAKKTITFGTKYGVEKTTGIKL